MRFHGIVSIFFIIFSKIFNIILTVEKKNRYLMAVKGVDCVVVGADRVAANGDTANKIGTYQLVLFKCYF